MTKFMSNMNKYLSVMKINQTYLSTLTGIDKNQLFHLLTGIQENYRKNKRRWQLN